MSDKTIDRKRRALLQAIGTLPLAAGLARAGVPQDTIRKAIPASGETLPVIGIGTSRVFDVGDSEAELRGPLEALAALQSSGNAMIDTSPMYGEAERVIGELLPRLPARPDFFLATKVWIDGRQNGIEQMDNSFRLMGVKVIDLMQIHNLVDWRTHIGTLRDWKARGRIRYIGITHYHRGAHQELMRVMQALPDLDFVQVNYSLLEPEAAQHLLPMAQERSVAVIANRPFGGGRWFGMTRAHPLPDWVQALGIDSWAQFALKWVVSHPAITCAIPGTSNAKHMLDDMQAGRGILLDAETRERMQGFIGGV